MEKIDYPKVIPAHRDKEGFFVDAKSSCCAVGLVYYDRKEDLYLGWDGSRPAPATVNLKSKLCNRTVLIGGRDG